MRRSERLAGAASPGKLPTDDGLAFYRRAIPYSVMNRISKALPVTFRCVLGVMALGASCGSAMAETWMVKSSTLACRDRETLEAHDATGATQVPDGCVPLDAGERLLELPGMGGGFDAYVKLQRHDRSVVFVSSAAVVPDPGIGSVYDER